MSKGASGKISGYQDGGKIPKEANPFVPFKYRDKEAAASGKWGEFGDYQRALDEPDSAEVAEKTKILRALLDEFIAEEAYKDSVENEMNRNFLLDSLINEAPPINKMLKMLPDSPMLENPPRPTKNQFLEELLKQGVII